MKNGLTKKEYEVKKIRVIDLFKTTGLNRSEIASVLRMTGSDVGTIIAASHTTKGDSKRVRPPVINPCMLSQTAWPRCYGQGCHWVKPSGESVCPAYNTMQIKIS